MKANFERTSAHTPRRGFGFPGAARVITREIPREALMLALIRRAGAGWIAATYAHDGTNADMIGGCWTDVRDWTLRAVGPALHSGARPRIWSCAGAGEKLLDATKPEQRTGI